MRLENAKVVVTGGAGFIGSHVVDALVATGSDVTAIDDLSVGERENLADAIAAGAKFVEGDVRDNELMAAELADANVVVHMACGNLRASLGDPVQSHELNATGTLRTCLSAVEAKVERIVYVSSSEAYGSAVERPMTESHPLLPTTVYGAAKAAGELYAQACMRTYGIATTVVRPFNSYGPREHAAGNSGEVIPKFVNRIRAGQPPVIFGDGSQSRDFTWVEETAAGIVAAAASDDLVGGAVNIAYGSPTSIAEIATKLVEIMDVPELSAVYEEDRPGDVAEHWADNARAKEILGFEPKVAISDGLARYVDWALASTPDPAGHEELVRNW